MVLIEAEEIRERLLTKGVDAAEVLALKTRDAVPGLESVWREKFEAYLEAALEAAGLGGES